MLHHCSVQKTPVHYVECRESVDCNCMEIKGGPRSTKGTRDAIDVQSRCQDGSPGSRSHKFRNQIVLCRSSELVV